MRVRAVEWRPAEGGGWAMVLPEHWGDDTVALMHAFDPTIDDPADLVAALPEGHALVGEGDDQLTIVFQCPWNETEAIGEWFAAIFPELENPWEVAETLREWDLEEPVMAKFPERAWNLFRLRVAVPVAQDGGPISEWTYATLVTLGRALLVFWYERSEEKLRTAARIDARARRGQYTGEPPSQSTADLASAYVAEVARLIRGCAGEAIKEVDDWETRLFDSAEQRFAGAEDPARLAELGAERRWAVSLRQNIDEIDRQINRGQHRSRWSTEGLEPVAESVDQELDAARAAVLQLKSDVADAFEAATTIAISRQLAASQEQQERADRFEGTVTKLTAFLLVPAFVAATFGANVELPGQGWVRTAIMLAAMVVGALATFVVLRRWDRAS